jgi:hypothetical protein
MKRAITLLKTAWTPIFAAYKNFTKEDIVQEKGNTVRPKC